MSTAKQQNDDSSDHPLVDAFKERTNAEEGTGFNQGNTPRELWIAANDVICLFNDDARKVGTVQLDDVDTEPDVIYETTHEHDGEETPVYVFEANGTYHTLGKEHVETVVDVIESVTDETFSDLTKHTRLCVTKGDVYPVVIDVPTEPYVFMIAPRVTNDGFGSSLKKQP